MKILLLLLALLAGCSTPPVAQVPVDNFPQVENTPTQIAAPAFTRKVFIAKSSLAWVIDLVDRANCIINNEEFIKEVEGFPGFTFTEATPGQVAASLRSMGPFTISTYKARIGSKVIATTYSSDKTTLYLNLRKNPRDIASMGNTVLHEGLHLAGYSHGNNSSVGKQDSINYRVGSIAEKYITLCK